MTMKKVLFTTYWSPQEAQSILFFLDERRDTLLANYGNEIAEYYRQITHHDIDFDFEDDTIPF